VYGTEENNPDANVGTQQVEVVAMVEAKSVCDAGTATNSCYTASISTNTCFVGEDIGTQTRLLTFNAETQTRILYDNVAVQCSPAYKDQATQIDCLTNNVATMTDISTDVPAWDVEHIKDDDDAIKFNTGFLTFAHLMACFNFLGPAVSNLCYGKKKCNTPVAGGRPHCLSPLNEFFLTMCRLRQSLKEQDLAYRFLISQPSVSRIFNTWVSFMFYKFKEVPLWPSRDVIDAHVPSCFRSMYPTTRCVIDATELFIEMPNNPSAQQLTFSNYKHHNTLKALIGITPSGAISFISGGNISDKKLTLESGILELFDPGDAIMADRGFNIADILPDGVSLNVPPRMNDSGQLTESERTTIRRIASIRIHVERAMERIKNYLILHEIPNSMHN